MTHYVVAVEFAGADLPAGVGGPRRPVREHAFDLDTGTFAPLDHHPRVGFPDTCRGWPSAQAALTCPDCRDAVARLVGSRIRHLVGRVVAGAITDRTIHQNTGPARRQDSTPDSAETP